MRKETIQKFRINIEKKITNAGFLLLFCCCFFLSYIVDFVVICGFC